MTFQWERRHWIVCGVLLVCQLLGLWAMGSHGAFALSKGTVLLPIIYLPGAIMGSVFLTSLALVGIFDVLFPKPVSSRKLLGIIVLWLVCMVGGAFLYWLIK